MAARHRAKPIRLAWKKTVDCLSVPVAASAELAE